MNRPKCVPWARGAMAALAAVAISGGSAVAQTQPGGNLNPITPIQNCNNPVPPDYLGGWALVETINNWQGPVDVTVVADGEFLVDTVEVEWNCGENYYDDCKDMPDPFPYMKIFTVTTSREYSVSAGYTLSLSSQAHASVAIKLIAEAALELGVEHEFSYDQFIAEKENVL